MYSATKIHSIIKDEDLFDSGVSYQIYCDVTRKVRTGNRVVCKDPGNVSSILIVAASFRKCPIMVLERFAKPSGCDEQPSGFESPHFRHLKELIMKHRREHD